jgi:hypothetical protein
MLHEGVVDPTNERLTGRIETEADTDGPAGRKAREAGESRISEDWRRGLLRIPTVRL